MQGSQRVGEALKHEDLRRNRRRHSTNWLVRCSVEDFAECRVLLLQEKKNGDATRRIRISIGQRGVDAEFPPGSACSYTKTCQ